MKLAFNQDEGVDLEGYLRDLFRRTFQACGLRLQDCVGTFHFYRRDDRCLIYFTRLGEVDFEPPTSQSVHKRDGIISWVALRQRALLINDLNKSEFRNIHVKIRNDTTSELAIPMLADGKLIGVVNLECVHSYAFSPELARTIWYMISLGALAHAVSSQMRQNERLVRHTNKLFDLHYRIARGLAVHPLEELAYNAKDWLIADLCDIWLYDQDSRSFKDGAATYPEFRDKYTPRKGGWTEYIRRKQKLVLIDDVVSAGSFSASFWSTSEETWKKITKGMPKRVNQWSLVGDDGNEFSSQMGIPIAIGDRCVAVIWVKYGPTSRKVPKAELVSIAFGFAGEVALIADFLIHQKEVLGRTEREEMTEQISTSMFPAGRIKLLSGLDCYVLYRPHGAKMGGDFHALVRLDKRSIGILLGDATGHGFIGALRMLPLLTTFRAYYRISRSTKHIIQKLHEVACDLNLYGTALYLIISKVRQIDGKEKLLLFASNAAHPPFTLCGTRSGEPMLKRFPSEDANMGLLGLQQLPVMGEDCIELRPGDVIVGVTDGITEAASAESTLLGSHKVIAEIIANFEGTPEDIAQRIFDRAVSHAKNQLEDDATIIVIKVNRIDENSSLD